MREQDHRGICHPQRWPPARGRGTHTFAHAPARARRACPDDVAAAGAGDRSIVVANPQGEPAWTAPVVGGRADAILDVLGHAGSRSSILRKEVIQPQVPLRLPCYDLVPITGFTFGACL
jgi:hypothetical protein